MRAALKTDAEPKALLSEKALSHDPAVAKSLDELIKSNWDMSMVMRAIHEIKELSHGGFFNAAAVWADLLHRNLERMADEANKAHGNQGN